MRDKTSRFKIGCTSVGLIKGKTEMFLMPTTGEEGSSNLPYRFWDFRLQRASPSHTSREAALFPSPICSSKSLREKSFQCLK